MEAVKTILLNIEGLMFQIIFPKSSLHSNVEEAELEKRKMSILGFKRVPYYDIIN